MVEREGDPSLLPKRDLFSLSWFFSLSCHCWEEAEGWGWEPRSRLGSAGPSIFFSSSTSPYLSPAKINERLIHFFCPLSSLGRRLFQSCCLLYFQSVEERGILCSVVFLFLVKPPGKNTWWTDKVNRCRGGIRCMRKQHWLRIPPTIQEKPDGYERVVKTRSCRSRPL